MLNTDVHERETKSWILFVLFCFVVLYVHRVLIVLWKNTESTSDWKGFFRKKHGKDLFPWNRNKGNPVMVESRTPVCWSPASALLSFLHLPPASAFAQLLLGFGRRGWDGGRVVVVVFLWSSEGGAKKHVADPGFEEGEGRAVGVSGCHHNLRGGRGGVVKRGPSRQ